MPWQQRAGFRQGGGVLRGCGDGCPLHHRGRFCLLHCAGTLPHPGRPGRRCELRGGGKAAAKRADRPGHNHPGDHLHPQPFPARRRCDHQRVGRDRGAGPTGALRAMAAALPGQHHGLVQRAQLGSAPLAGGAASITVRLPVAAGSHGLVVDYSGDAVHAPMSQGFTQAVVAAPVPTPVPALHTVALVMLSLLAAGMGPAGCAGAAGAAWAGRPGCRAA